MDKFQGCSTQAFKTTEESQHCSSHVLTAIQQATKTPGVATNAKTTKCHEHKDHKWHARPFMLEHGHQTIEYANLDLKRN